MIQTLFKWLIYLALFALIAGATAYGVLVFIVEQPPSVVVPDLVEKDVVTVLEHLSTLGLIPDMGDLEYHDAIPKYHVTYQYPFPGAEVKSGRHVRINISAGVRRLQLPDFSGMPVARARALLAQIEMTPGPVSKTAHDQIPAGSVIAQIPLAGRAVDRGDSVGLLVSTGPVLQRFRMPDIQGMTVDAAGLRLERAGFQVGRLTADEDRSRPHNTVLKQDPPPGYPVEKGAAVALVVNRVAGGVAAGGLEQVRGGTLFTHRVAPGFLKKHVRLVLILYGQQMDMVDRFAAPGSQLVFLVPHAWARARIQVFENDDLTAEQAFSSEAE
ncbi:MAG: hypothetical protein CSA22_08465 [Deltaproteobacteria bacterium]|nr:MAG: hypothetical protein CSA22_08465 [Deltaproteobacteria bacterium]